MQRVTPDNTDRAKVRHTLAKVLKVAMSVDDHVNRLSSEGAGCDDYWMNGVPGALRGQTCRPPQGRVASEPTGPACGRSCRSCLDGVGRIRLRGRRGSCCEGLAPSGRAGGRHWRGSRGRSKRCGRTVRPSGRSALGPILREVRLGLGGKLRLRSTPSMPAEMIAPSARYGLHVASAQRYSMCETSRPCSRAPGWRPRG